MRLTRSRELLRAFTNSKMDMVEKMDLAGETELAAPAIGKGSI
jgi:hypothetical protein